MRGRGLMLIRTFMDEVRLNDVGNEITLFKAASATAGAVLRPAGSRIIVADRPMASICSATRKRCVSLHTTTHSSAADASPLTRAAVSCSIVASLTRGRSCLGYMERDAGQRRVPDPPERMTGIIMLMGALYRPEPFWQRPASQAAVRPRPIA